ncbi:glutamine-hydrolyzing carbamoyl-phosphate synthase small subunit [Polycyclovorans algicola]|uniref:glutamine-hydrolyzing carbamoyl-phosphate synthase small subunit n=1 Tax=Polycyclovorans algicola TaxID=616992 RepID=UPI0005BADE0B|nr:glutamine-hydrolyzing carbamoyl-phosphate synthase small subunit [Polycyclovorans algicola]
MTALPPAVLALADGSVFPGVSIGVTGETVGEVVFNTAMTGYQEVLTDPSYRQQIVTLTYPHIGNVGVNPEDAESDDVHIAGLVIREVPRPASNFRSKQNFRDYLMANGAVAIAQVDTRALTRRLRDTGAQNGAIVAGEGVTAERAIELAKGFAGLKGADLAQVVTCGAAHAWTTGSWQLASNAETTLGEARFHVVVMDFGVKRNILRMLVDRGCRLTVVPAKTSAEQILALKPDGVLLSNGPGDPEPCTYAIAAARELIARKVPTFGICLGHQILGLAAGAKTVKMKFGHHGANHPVQDLDNGKVMITSQNHGFAVDDATLPANVRATHRSLFDGSLQGIALTDAPAFSFQGHPEASPGPHDVAALFDRFIDLMTSRSSAN